MRFDEVVDTIIALHKNVSLVFQAKAFEIEQALNARNESELLDHLDYAGVIPECFSHDSTEEKLFAKYCDALLAKAWTELGLKAKVILKRADAADVIATVDNYTLVGDAKAFRLSRTAKNQKDFKVEALNEWRKGADYACLVGPLYQFPKKESQIYSQARRYNVTLLSYTHLGFLIRHRPKDLTRLRSLWEVGKSLPSLLTAETYWLAVVNVICNITDASVKEWVAAVSATYERLPKQADEQIHFWEEEKKRLAALPHDVAVKELIGALKIDSKIAEIRKSAKIVTSSIKTTAPLL